MRLLHVIAGLACVSSAFGADYGTVNLAFGKPVTALTATVQGAPADVTDGRLNSTWFSYQNPTASTIGLTIDLGATSLIGRIDIYQAGSFGVTVDTSLDGTQWTQRAKYDWNRPVSLAFSVDAQGAYSARYIRYTAYNAWDQYIGIGELQVYGWNPAANPPPASSYGFRNLALGQPAVDFYASGSPTNDLPPAAVDGSLATSWIANNSTYYPGADTNYAFGLFRLDLGQSYRIGKVIVRPNAIQSYQVIVSDYGLPYPPNAGNQLPYQFYSTGYPGVFGSATVNTVGTTPANGGATGRYIWVFPTVVTGGQTPVPPNIREIEVFEWIAGNVESKKRDFRGNQRQDVLLYDPANGNSYAGLTNGDGTFAYVYAPYTTGFDVLRSADLNADGKADSILYNSANQLGYAGSSNANGTFDYKSLFWGPGFTQVNTGDLDGDKRSDVVIYRPSDGTMYAGISIGAGNGQWNWVYKYTLISIGFTAIRVGDFTGDGRADVFAYRASDGLAFIGIGNGDGSFQFNPVTVGTGYDLIDTGDVDGDGKIDLLLYNSTSGATRVGISTGVNFTLNINSYSPGFTAARLVDATGDGKADVVLYNKNTTLGYFGLGAGNGTFTFGSLFWGPGMDNVEPQDLNNDGKIDLVLYNSSTGTAYAAVSNGSGGFTYVYSYWGPGKALAR